MLDTDTLSALSQPPQSEAICPKSSDGYARQAEPRTSALGSDQRLPRTARSSWLRQRRAAHQELSKFLKTTIHARGAALTSVDRDFLRVQIAAATRWLKALEATKFPGRLLTQSTEYTLRVWTVALTIVKTLHRDGSLPEIVAQSWRDLEPETIELCELQNAIRTAILVELALGTAESTGQDDAARQTQASLRVGLLIDTLHLVEKADWASIVEGLSPIDEIFSRDPTHEFATLPSPTRALYRQATSELARKMSTSETNLARQAIGFAAEHHLHVGRVVLGPDFPRRATAKVRGRATTAVFQTPRRTVIYIALQALCLALVAAVASIFLGGWSIPHLVPFCAIALLASVTSNWLVNNAYQRLTPPRKVPSLDFATGIPSDARTVVAVPQILNNTNCLPAALGRLEELYLCGTDPQLSYMLLTDLKDSAAPSVDDEHEMERTIAAGISELNHRYAPLTPFGALHRRRAWNPSQGRWMGRERKRGKLQDLNRYILGESDAFSLKVGSAMHIRGARYVVTLDCDTLVEQGTIRRLCELIHHPVNQPRVGLDGNTHGYGIVQPTVVTLKAGEQFSLFEWATNPTSGIDPYSDAQADLYFNLFDEGSFIGKGIYDVAWMERCAGSHLPDDRILSHDQLEGALAHCCVATKVNVYERPPADYREDAERRMRWIRGDWQNLLLVIFGRCLISARDGRTARISQLAAWKLLDNARRSVVPAVLMAVLGTALVRNRSSDWQLLLVCLALAGAPAIVRGVSWGSQKISGRSDAVTPSSLIVRVAQFTVKAGLTLATLPFEFTRLIHEVVSSVWRVAISGRNLLQWQPYGSHVRSKSSSLTSYYRYMGVGSILGAAVSLLNLTWVGIALSCIWGSAPWIASALSKPRSRSKLRMTSDNERYLYDLGRRTWSFFEDHVNAQTNWLPPDHIRADNKDLLEVVAARTSSTNIGLGLLATLAAYDMGYICLDETLDRLERSLKATRSLARYRGHLYNWYSLSDLKPSEPQYVSMVDSGNFRACIVTLRQALGEAELQTDSFPRLRRGLMSTISVFIEMVAGLAVPELVQIEQFTRKLGDQEDTAHFMMLLEQLVSLVRSVGAAQRARGNLIPAYWAEKVEAAAGRVAIYRPSASSPAPGRLAGLVSICDDLIACDESFGYVHKKALFSIGLSPARGRLDDACYDMLASEARLGVYLAISRGGAPASAWWRLSRGWSSWRGGASLLSWSGSMFEYFMPELLLPTVPQSLMAETLQRVVRVQKVYAKRRGLPWGVSEAGLSSRDVNGEYQYCAMGIPELGLQRDLGGRDVVAPYATALALAVDVKGAVANFHALDDLGALGHRGFFESVDFGPVGDGPRVGHVVFEYMAHHQGMTLLAITSALCQQPMQRRFTRDPSVRAASALLSERVPDWAQLAKRSTCAV